MCYHLLTTNGGMEAIIDDNCGINKFYAIANTLADRLKIQFITQVDDAETLDWDFKYKDLLLTLHYNIFNGVSIYPQNFGNTNQKKHNSAVMEVAKFLEKHAY
ncbi:MAG: hypothetical protein KF829_09850 [Ferruginibacter sp.]|nr:hypothetical protein [Ferruginibacter sp.]